MDDILDIFLDTRMVIPANQMVLYVGLISLFLLFGRQRLCILISFLFTFYWGFIFNRDLFVDRLGNAEVFMALYLISGFFLVLMAVFVFFSSRD